MNGMQYYPFERNHYYCGKFLSADDLDCEQSYMNHKRWFLNQFLHGSGVVFGLSVLMVSERTFAVQPGVALDYAGREIIVDKPLLLTLSNLMDENISADAAVLYLNLYYDEVPQQTTNDGRINFLSEYYRFSLSDMPPIHAQNTARSFLMHSEQVYSSESYTVTQILPSMVQAGGETTMEVHIQRHLRDASIHFSYQLRLTGMKSGGERVVTVQYDSARQPMENDHAVLNIPLHILLNADGEEAAAETVQDSFMSTSDQRAEGFSVVRMTAEAAVGDLRRKLLERFREVGMQEMICEQTCQPPICLAAIHLTEKNGNAVISHIEKMPFMQFVNSGSYQELAELLSGGTQMTGIHSVQEVSAGNPTAKKLMQQYSVSSGVTEISMPFGGRTGQKFFSEPILHGLGVGRTAITLGFAPNENETLYGSIGVFAEDKYDIHAELAAKLDTSLGSFVIGMQLTRPATAGIVKIHWTAVHCHTAEAVAVHPHLIITPNIVSLNVMENINFEVQFEQCPKQAVHWSIAEGARGGVITEGGAYTAPNTPGVYQIQVRSVETGLQASAFVSVRDLHET